MLNLKITEVALGSDTTIVVTGDGDQAHQNLRELAATGSGQHQGGGGGENAFRQAAGGESLQLSAPRVLTAADLCLLARPAPTAGPSPSSLPLQTAGSVGGGGGQAMKTSSSLGAGGRGGQGSGDGQRTNTAAVGGKGDTEENHRGRRKIEEESDEKRGEGRNGVIEKQDEEKTEREVEVEGKKSDEGDVKNTERKREKQAKVEEKSSSFSQGEARAERQEDPLRQKSQSFSVLPVEEDPLQSSSSNPMKAPPTSGVHTPQNPQEQRSLVLPSSSSDQQSGALNTAENSEVHQPINDSKETQGDKREDFAPKPPGESREVTSSLQEEQNTNTPQGRRDYTTLPPTGGSCHIDSASGLVPRESKDETQEENSPIPARNLFSSRSDSLALNGTSKPE